MSMISARMGSAAAVTLLTLAGCGSIGVALGTRTRLDKLPVTALSATLSPQASLTPGQSGRLVIVASGADGKTWTTVGAGRGTVLFDSFKFESTVVNVNSSGYVRLPSDPRVSSGKSARIHITVVGHPDVQADFDVPVKYNVAFAAHFTGASGNDGFSGTDGLAGADGTLGSLDPTNPAAGGTGSNGSNGIGTPNGTSGSAGMNGLDGNSGFEGPPGRIIVTIDPAAEAYRDKLHFSTHGRGRAGPAAEFHTEPVSPLW